MTNSLNPAEWLLNYDPATHDGNRVTPLIDGESYFLEIDSMLASLGQDDFFYCTGWEINANMLLDWATPSAPTFLDRLSVAHTNGVKVRFLLYKGMHESGFKNWWHPEEATQTHYQFVMQMIALGHEVIIDFRHPQPAGSHHGKYVIVGKQDSASGEYVLTGYVGGIDLAWGRWATPEHPDQYTWHDVQYKVEGPIVFELLRDFEQRWDSHPLETASADGRLTKSVTSSSLAWGFNIRKTPVGTAAVQHLFTYPCAPANLKNGRSDAEYIRDAYYAFVPRGMRTIEDALCNAIQQARVYIYLENYAFSHHRIAQAIADRLNSDPALVVIFLGDYWVHPIFQPDISDAFNTIRAARNGHNFKTFDLRHPNSIYDPVEPDYPDENYLNTIYLHSKVGIVDDRWATVGSANFNYRSMTTDGEVNIGFVDNSTLLDIETDLRVSANVRAFRKQLWAEHLQISETDGRLEHMLTALDTWDSLAQNVPYVLPPVNTDASQARVFHRDLALRDWRYYTSPGSYWPVWDFYIDPQTEQPETD